MKRSNYLTIALVSLLFSCGKGEGVGEEYTDMPMYFDVAIVSEPITKGLPVTSVNASSMGVYAYYTETTAWSAARAAATPNWMNNQPIGRVNNTAPWASDQTVYWPAYTAGSWETKLSFFAYAPYATPDNGIVLSVGVGVPQIAFDIDTEVNGQTDLLLATPAIDQNKTLNNGKMNFSFVHKLSKIGFRAYCLTPGSTIQTLSLTQLAVSGSIPMDAAATWVLTADRQELTLNLNGTPLSTNPQKPTYLSDPNNYFFLFPADYRTTSQTELVVVYKEKNEEKTARVPITEQWQQGKSILYSLNLGGKANEDMTIESVTIDAWEVSGREDLETN